MKQIKKLFLPFETPAPKQLTDLYQTQSDYLINRVSGKAARQPNQNARW